MINDFSGTYAFLSNFFESPLLVPRLGICNSVEHAYQAMKTLDKTQQEQVLLARTPGEAKKKGRRVDLRPDWEMIKYEVMSDLITIKFFFDTKLSVQLLSTGDCELVEGNWWGDTYWGVCEGVGSNYLGKLLMKRRETLRGVPF